MSTECLYLIKNGIACLGGEGVVDIAAPNSRKVKDFERKDFDAIFQN